MISPNEKSSLISACPELPSQPSLARRFRGVLSKLLEGIITNATSLSLTISAVGCGHYAVKTNSKLIEEDFGAKICFIKRQDGGHLSYQRYAGADCDDSANEMATHGALGDKGIWNAYAHTMSEEEARKFISIDLPGHGNSSPLPSDLKANPQVMGDYISEAADKLLDPEETRTLYAHSAAGPSTIFALETQPETTQAILINPALAASRESVLNPGRNFPIICNLGELATSIARRGFSVSYDQNAGQNRGPSILGLGGTKNGEFAYVSNLAIPLQVESGYEDLIPSLKPEENTPITRQALSLKENCKDQRDFTNSVRQERWIAKWRDAYLEAFKRHERQTAVVVGQGDPVIDPKSTTNLIREEALNVVLQVIHKPNAHEIMSINPEGLHHVIEEKVKPLLKFRTTHPSTQSHPGLSH